MRKQRYNFDDLLIQLRENNIDSIQDVSYAILEPSGKLAVVEKKTSANMQRLSSRLLQTVWFSMIISSRSTMMNSG